MSAQTTSVSAERRRAMLRTTIVSFIVVGLYVLVTRGMGLSFDDIPRIVPRFD